LTGNEITPDDLTEDELTQRRKDAEEFNGCRMSENEIAKEIVDAAYKIHVSLGPGLLESV
jgi:hypothetical protein